MRAGELDRRIRIEQPIEKQDPGTGEVIPDWLTVAEVWAKRRDVRPSEVFASQHVTADVEAVFTIRYREGIEPEMRIVEASGQTWDIRPPVEIGGRHEALEIPARRRIEEASA